MSPNLHDYSIAISHSIIRPHKSIIFGNPKVAVSDASWGLNPPRMFYAYLLLLCPHHIPYFVGLDPGLGIMPNELILPR